MATIGERSIEKTGGLKCYLKDNWTKVSGRCREGGHTSGVDIKRVPLYSSLEVCYKPLALCMTFMTIS